MARFNLLDEPWITVVVNNRGETKAVSLKQLFNNAHLYRGLAGDTKAQDFAVLRVLLAVLHTVFSRVDANGQPYDYFDLDDKFRQLNKIDEDEVDDYKEDLYDTWLNLWQKKQFPKIVDQYLEAWRDRFYLFDDNYPFFQVTKCDIAKDKINKSKATKISGKNINRLISESNNKIALFSPKCAANNNKERLTEAEIARWIITFQGYTGIADKTKYKDKKYSPSFGWLFRIGGIYLGGNNLFETLLLNCILPYNECDNLLHMQQPCWELTGSEVINNCFRIDSYNNLACLYTAWSRAVYIEPNFGISKPFECQIVKLPAVNYRDNFLEPMTLLRDVKKQIIPIKHQLNKAMWRSFGLIAMGISNGSKRKPGIIDWLNNIRIFSEKNVDLLGQLNPILYAISIQDDGKAQSRLLIEEIFDYLKIDHYVLTDLEQDGWVIRINEVVEEIKDVIEYVYRGFIQDIQKIRNISTNIFVSQAVEELYFIIDQPFRAWLLSICVSDSKDKMVMIWRKQFKKIVNNQAEELLYNGAKRDYMGVVDKDSNRLKNNATAYNTFLARLNKKLIIEEEKHGR